MMPHMMPRPSQYGRGIFFCKSVGDIKRGCIFALFKQTNTTKNYHVMSNSMIYKELCEKSNATIQYSCSYKGGMYVRTHLTLLGRGIKMSSDGSGSKDGKKSYHVTSKAFEKLEAIYSTCYLSTL